MSDSENWLAQKAETAIKNLCEIGKDQTAPAKARAYAKGIPPIYATDTVIYLGLSLAEIAEEWCIDDPVDLLAVMVAWNESRNNDPCKDK